MGAEMSSPQKRARTEDDAQGTPAKSASKGGGGAASTAKRQKKERRKSGRNDRRSLLDNHIDPAILGAFYEDIDKDASEADRFSELLDQTFQHGLKTISSDDLPDGLSKKAAKEHLTGFYKKWKEEHEDEFEDSCKAHTPDPNPRNAAVADTAKRYKNTQKRLEKELSTWEAALSDAEAAAKSTGEKNSASKQRTQNTKPPAPLAAWKEDVEFQIEGLEDIVERCGKIKRRGDKWVAKQSSNLAHKSSSDPNSPRTLIQQATRGR